LKDQITLHLKGRVLRNLKFLSDFKDFEFVSQLVFAMETMNYGVGEDIITVKTNASI